MSASAPPLLGRLTDGRGTTSATWTVAPLTGAEHVAELVPDGRRGRDGGGLRSGPDGGRRPAGVVERTGRVVPHRGRGRGRRVLLPAGALVVVTPSAAARTPAQLRARAVHRHSWPNRSGSDDVGWLLAVADVAVVAHDRAVFTIDLPQAGAEELAAELSASGLWPPR